MVKDLLAAESFFEASEAYYLAEVEPFTIVTADWRKELVFAEFVWDGSKKYYKNLPLKPHIWSSSPLYSEDMKKLREEWFQTLQQEGELTPEALLNFHFSAGQGDKDKGLIMDRGFVKTKSISQIILNQGKIDFYYKDLATEEVSKMTF